MNDISVGSILFTIFYAAMMSFSISIIIFVLLYANNYVDKAKIERLRKTDENRYYNYLLKRKLADRAICATIIIGILIIFFSLVLRINVTVVDEETKSSTDIENWASLVIELGLGAYIALAILTYENFRNKKSEKQQKEIGDIVKKIENIALQQQKIIEEQNKRDLKKKTTGEFFITHACYMLAERSVFLFNEFQKFLNKEIDKKKFEIFLEQWHRQRDLAIEHIENHYAIYSDVLNDDTNLWLFEIIEQLKSFSKPAFDSQIANTLLFGLFTHIDAISKNMTSRDLKQRLDKNDEFQKIMKTGKTILETFVKSPQYTETLQKMGFSEDAINKLKNFKNNY